MVTGSARLDYYRKGGDSLLGRYYYHRLHPLILVEIGAQRDIEHLLKFSGFPEPFLLGDDIQLKRWHRQRRERVIYTDIRDLENIREISMIEILIDALAPRVGSPRIRAVKKEQKLYLWDWSEHADWGKRWENFVASHLLKYCHFIEDTKGDKMELRFLRDTDKREIDFVVLKNNNPLFAVECKAGEKSLSPHIQYFSERTSIPALYQVHSGVAHRQISKKISLLPFAEFCTEVGLI